MLRAAALLIAHFICAHRCAQFSYSRDDETVAAIAEGVRSFYRCHTEAASIQYALARGIPVANVPSTPVQSTNVTFKLFTRQNPRVAQTLRTPESIRESYFSAEKLTVLYATGTLSRYTDDTSRLTEGLLPSFDLNLIMVDWDSYAFYNISYTRNYTAPRVAKFVAQFIERLYTQGANAKQMYLSGVSTGGQIVGLAAKYLRTIYPKVARITAVDPVGACYSYLPPSQKLTRDDADFVQLMHCSIGDHGVPLDYRGSTTFYMNGGIIQPQCINESNLQDVTLCSHRACKEYFLQSLQNFNMFYGVKCDSFEQYRQRTCDCTRVALVGFYAPSSSRGVYFADVIPFSPTSNCENCARSRYWF